MSRQRKERPDGCVVYGSALRQILLLPDVSAGRVIKGTARLFLEGVEPDGLDFCERLVFALFRDNVRESLERFHDRCTRNKAIADNRASGHDSSPLVTSGSVSLPGAPIEPNQIEPNQIEPNQIEPNQIEPRRGAPPKAANARGRSSTSIDLSWRETGHAFSPDDVIEDPPGSGCYRLQVGVHERG